MGNILWNNVSPIEHCYLIFIMLCIQCFFFSMVSTFNIEDEDGNIFICNVVKESHEVLNVGHKLRVLEAV